MNFRMLDVLDIIVVAVAIYYVLVWLQGTRAVALIRGLAIVLLIYLAAKLLGLYTTSWMLERLGTAHYRHHHHSFSAGIKADA